MSVQVAINGYGTIGKRVADAVSAQDDMEVIGVTKFRPTIEAEIAIECGYSLFAGAPEKKAAFDAAGISVDGTIHDLLANTDIVVDCAPERFGAANKKMYEKAGVKAIFQGGEKHERTGISFNSFANYAQALGQQFVRVVSCNTTGLCRTLHPLQEKFGIGNVKSVIVRRGVDPHDSEKGPVNAIIPVLKVPSHHGPDVRTCMPGLDIQTMAVAVPTTLMHLHSNIVELAAEVGPEEVLAVWDVVPRIKVVESAKGITSTAQVMELSRDLGRKRADLNEIAVWREGVHVVGNTLYYYQAIHQESDVIPENIDCIRAMMELETDNRASIRKTNKAMRIS